MTPEEDQSRQHGHAEQIREMREQQRGHGDDGSRVADLEKTIATLKADNEALKARLDAIEQASICGAGFSGTIKDGISYDPTSTGTDTGNGGGGTRYALELCDGTTLDVNAFNIVPP